MEKKFRTIINPQGEGYALVQCCLVFNEEGEQVDTINNPAINHANIETAWASATAFINQNKD